MKKLVGALAAILVGLAVAQPAWAGGKDPGRRPDLPIAAVSAPAAPAATSVTGHYVTFSFTASTSNYSGLGYNVYFGTAAGGESTTPVNTSLLTSVCSGTACTITITSASGSGGNATSSLIVPMATIYATVEACVPFESTTICSAPSNEVSCTIPLISSDIAPPASLAGSVH